MVKGVTTIARIMDFINSDLYGLVVFSTRNNKSLSDNIYLLMKVSKQIKRRENKVCSDKHTKLSKRRISVTGTESNILKPLFLIE